MAYNRAPRRSLVANNQTGPNVSPNSYQVGYQDTCSCKGTNWAPFLTCAARKTTPLQTTPSPDAYHPQNTHKILGGSSLRYTAQRFPEPRLLVPAPNEYDPYHTSEEPLQDPPPRLKGYLYHCHVPYTILGYVPSIPTSQHHGYKILEDRTLTECCYQDNDTTLGPAFYQLNFDTFGTCYRGSYWSKYSRRRPLPDSKTPGVGTYDLELRPTQLQEYLNKVRHERQKNACVLRYMDQVQNTALRNDYPAPNQYDVVKVNKCPRAKPKPAPKTSFPPPKIDPRNENKNETPAPNQYTDPRTAFEYLTKPSCKKELNAFLVNAPRFIRAKRDGPPAPNRYHIKSFVEELALRVSPYAVRNTAFDTSVPKKLYYLPPDYPPVPTRKRCRCSETPAAPEPPPPRPHPTYPLSSKTPRFTTAREPYEANCASYSIQKSFLYLTAPRSFRKAKRYNFLFKEKRFARITGFGSREDKRYIPVLKYDLEPRRPVQPGPVSFSRSERTFEKVAATPGPLHYGNLSPGLKKRTFNVTLGGSSPLTPYQKYRTRLQGYPFRVHRRRRYKFGKGKRSVCLDVPLVNIEFPVLEGPKNKKCSLSLIKN